MRRFMIEKKEGMSVFLLADHIEVIDGMLCVTEYSDDGPVLVGVFREYAACWEMAPSMGAISDD